MEAALAEFDENGDGRMQFLEFVEMICEDADVFKFKMSDEVMCLWTSQPNVGAQCRVTNNHGRAPMSVLYSVTIYSP